MTGFENAARNATPNRLSIQLTYSMHTSTIENVPEYFPPRTILITIRPADLIVPIDVHVARVSKHFGLITRTQIDWQTAMELTYYCRTLDPKDPVKYDFALFSLGVTENVR